MNIVAPSTIVCGRGATVNKPEFYRTLISETTVEGATIPTTGYCS
jgi:hypothetical protein